MTTESLDDILADVLARRARGDSVDERALIEAHADIAEALLERLDALRLVERARVIASLPDGPDGAADAARSGLIVPGYTLLREIARGGQSIVHLAKRDADETLVALKLLTPERSSLPSERTRLDRELEVLQSIDHPGVVRVLDHGRLTDQSSFIVTRFIEGEPLRPERLARGVSLEERLLLFRQTCDAVAAAHAQGIVHRDLKPSNIRIDLSGRPHVLDFGLATRLDPDAMRQSLTVTGEFVGTFLWASPEQKQGRSDLTAASDVYSLGILLHQLVSGGSFPPQVYRSLEHVVSGTAAEGSSRLPGVHDRRLREVIRRCLDQDPARRYPDARALGEAVARIPRPRQTHWWLLTIAIAGLAAGSIGWWVWGRDRLPHGVVWTQTPGGRPVLHLANLPPLAWIPPGEFEMGSPEAENGYPDERPQRRISIDRGFFMGIYEISQAQYEAVMGINPARFAEGSARPVERVSYHDAVEFCRRLTEQTGRVVRLPTEAEWEYAARAGSTTPHHFGSDERLALRYANFADLSNTNPAIAGRMNYDDGFPQTSDVGLFVSNDFHLYDMHGNVWEWCQSPYQIDPTDPSTARDDLASARGGSWWDMPRAGRSANRNPLKLDEKVSTLGFRVVVEEEN
jgi:formylglycine-generating enzyme required for sulfatase activity